MARISVPSTHVHKVSPRFSLFSPFPAKPTLFEFSYVTRNTPRTVVAVIILPLPVLRPPDQIYFTISLECVVPFNSLFPSSRIYGTKNLLYFFHECRYANFNVLVKERENISKRRIL